MLSLLEVIGGNEEREFTLPEMEEWGAALGKVLPQNAIVTLRGDLGTGKTTLARALCKGLGVYELNAVTSPTFAIIQEYPSIRGNITHADLYRLRNDAELDALGWEEIMASAAALIVEWPERYSRQWPKGSLHIALAYGSTGFNTRKAYVTIT